MTKLIEGNRIFILKFNFFLFTYSFGVVLIMNFDNSVGIVTGWTAEVQVPSRASIKTGSGAHSTSCPMGTGGSRA
jgi:hypothetical protein